MGNLAQKVGGWSCWGVGLTLSKLRDQDIEFCSLCDQALVSAVRQGERLCLQREQTGSLSNLGPQQVCRGFMESCSWAGDFILGVAKQCHSANWTLKTLQGWKLHGPHSPDCREKEMSGVALRGSWWGLSPQWAGDTHFLSTLMLWDMLCECCLQNVSLW